MYMYTCIYIYIYVFFFCRGWFENVTEHARKFRRRKRQTARHRGKRPLADSWQNGAGQGRFNLKPLRWPCRDERALHAQPLAW